MATPQVRATGQLFTTKFKLKQVKWSHEHDELTSKCFQKRGNVGGKCGLLSVKESDESSEDTEENKRHGLV